PLSTLFPSTTLFRSQAALDIRLHHPQVQRGDAIDAHMTGHLLVLPGLAGVLTATGRTDRTVRDRHTVRGAQTAEVPTLHTAGEADRKSTRLNSSHT